MACACAIAAASREKLEMVNYAATTGYAGSQLLLCAAPLVRPNYHLPERGLIDASRRRSAPKLLTCWSPGCLEAVCAAEALLADATLAVRERVSVDGGGSRRALFDREQRADPRPRLACDLCRSAAAARGLCRADAGRGHVRRDRGTDRPHRHRRISGADSRRHPDEPGRDRAARPISACRRRRRGTRDASGRRL